MLNQSSCLLCCQLRFQCHNAELKANDVEVCFISMCMTGRFVEWKMIHQHRNKNLLHLGLSLRNVQICRSFTWNTVSRENDSSCMIIRLCGLNPYPVKDSNIQWDKGKYPKSLVCVPDTSPPSDAWPSFLCKVDHNDSLRVNTSNQPFPPPPSQPLH